MHQSAPSRSAPAHARRTGPAPRDRAATAFKACPTAPEALERAAVEAIAAVAAHPAMGPKEVRVMCALTCLLAVPGPAIRIGRERIAARAGLSLRSIGDGLRALTGAGLIERTEPVFRKTTTTTVNELVGPIRAHRHEPDCARDSRWHVVRTALHAACVDPRIRARGPRLLALAAVRDGGVEREALLALSRAETREGRATLDALLLAGYLEDRDGRIHGPSAAGLRRAVDGFCPPGDQPTRVLQQTAAGKKCNLTRTTRSPAGDAPSPRAIDTSGARTRVLRSCGAGAGEAHNAAAIADLSTVSAELVRPLASTLARRAPERRHGAPVEDDLACIDLQALGVSAGDRRRICETPSRTPRRPGRTTRRDDGRRAARAAAACVEAGAQAAVFECLAMIMQAAADGALERARAQVEALVRAIVDTMVTVAEDATERRQRARRSASVERARDARDERTLAEEGRADRNVAPGRWTPTRWTRPGEPPRRDDRKTLEILSVRAGCVIDRAEAADTVLGDDIAKRVERVRKAVAQTARNLVTLRGDSPVVPDTLTAIALEAARAKGWA